jgi:hypothetical protein
MSKGTAGTVAGVKARLAALRRPLVHGRADGAGATSAASGRRAAGPRTPAAILEEWRAAERRLGLAELGSREWLDGRRTVDRLRDEYGQAFELDTRDDQAAGVRSNERV